MPLEEYIISVFCMVDKLLKKSFSDVTLRERGFPPKLTDAEVITMEIVGEFLKIDTDTGIWRYFHEHWLSWFPQLGSRANFAKQAANLWHIKQKIQRCLLDDLRATVDSIHFSDGFPIPICHFKRAYFSSLFKGEATYGHCASKAETYYGFKGNLVISSSGIITGVTVTQAHIDERESLYDIVGNVDGLLIADKGLIGEDYQKQFRLETGVNLQTPTRSNMHDPRGKDCNRWLTSTRRLVETVIGQLTERFQIEKVRARDLWHLTSRIARKVLAHTVSAAINKKAGNPILQFEHLAVS